MRQLYTGARPSAIYLLSDHTENLTWASDCRKTSRLLDINVHILGLTATCVGDLGCLTRLPRPAGPVFPQRTPSSGLQIKSFRQSNPGWRERHKTTTYIPGLWKRRSHSDMFSSVSFPGLPQLRISPLTYTQTGWQGRNVCTKGQYFAPERERRHRCCHAQNKKLYLKLNQRLGYIICSHLKRANTHRLDYSKSHYKYLLTSKTQYRFQRLLSRPRGSHCLFNNSWHHVAWEGISTLSILQVRKSALSSCHVTQL